MPSPVQPHPKLTKYQPVESSDGNDLEPIGINMAANRLYVKGTSSP